MMFTEKPEITIRNIQQFYYCPHRWGLIAIEGLWEDNYKTVEGSIIHEAVNDPFFNETRKDRRTVRALPVFSDKHNLFGVCDCVEFGKKSPDGKFIDVNIVEYKNGEPLNGETINFADQLQVAAQALCINEMLNCQCTAELYYAKVHRRRPCPLTQLIFDYVIELLEHMRFYMNRNEIPPIRPGQNCSACSLKNICLPKTKTIGKSVFTEIKELGKGE